MNQDWVHGILRIGTLQKELNHARSDCDTFLKGDIRFTRAGKVDIHKVFSRYGEDDDEDKGLKVSPIDFHPKCEVKGSASEFLGLSALCDFIDSLLDLKGIEAWTDEVCDRLEDRVRASGPKPTSAAATAAIYARSEHHFSRRGNPSEGVPAIDGHVAKRPAKWPVDDCGGRQARQPTG